MKFECVPCEYTTLIKSHYDRHMKSEKHTTENIKFDCKYCEAVFIRSSNLIKHSDICKEKANYPQKLENQIKILKNTVIELENNTTEINHKNIELQKTVAMLQNDSCAKTDKIKELEKAYTELNNKYQTELKAQLTISQQMLTNSGTLINNSLNTVNKTVSALTYINKHFNNAPPIKPMINFDAFKKPKPGQLVEELVYNYRNRRLANYIGDVYANEYVTDDPTKQTVWNKDNVRLTYYVRVLLHDQPNIDKNENTPIVGKWITDKKGIYVGKCTIKPILQFLNNEVKKYIKVNNAILKKSGHGDNGRLINLLTACTEISILLDDNGKLETDILKYIAPKFDIGRVNNNKFIEYTPSCETGTVEEGEGEGYEEDDDADSMNDDNVSEYDSDVDEDDYAYNLDEYEYEKEDEVDKEPNITENPVSRTYGADVVVFEEDEIPEKIKDRVAPEILKKLQRTNKKVKN